MLPSQARCAEYRLTCEPPKCKNLGSEFHVETVGYEKAMKTLLQILLLVVCLVVGIWMAGRGIAVIVAPSALAGPQEDFLRHLVEGGFCLVGGICVLSVAVQQFICWRAHRKQGGLI